METRTKLSDPLVQSEFFSTSSSSISSSSPQSDSSSISQAGPFRLGKTLGKGTTGIVCVGTHVENGFQVALKIVKKKHVLKTPTRLRVLRREIAVMKLIDHPNIIKLYDVFESEDKIYLVTELATGGELFELLREGPLSRGEALRLFSQITMGLLHCHEHGIVHRDLKPENLLLDEHKNAKIADFGMAQLMQEGAMLKTSCGSPHYASPEVIAEGRYDGKISDVWSLGVILFAMVTGSLPFDHENIPTLLKIVRAGQFEIPEFVDEDIAHLLRQMIKLDHKERIKMEEIQNHPVFARTHYFRARKKSSFSPLSARLDESSSRRRRHSDSTLTRIDESLIEDLVALLGFESREELRSKILAPGSNTEKSLYSLLVTRKRDRLATLSRLSPRTPSSSTTSSTTSKSSSPVSPFSVPASRGAVPPPMELPPTLLAPLEENKIAEATEFAPLEDPLTDISSPIFSAGYSSRSPTVRSRRSSGSTTPTSSMIGSTASSRRESVDSVSSGSSRRSSPQVSAPSSRRASGLVLDSISATTSPNSSEIIFTEPKTSVTPTGRVRTLLGRKQTKSGSEMGGTDKKISVRSWLEKFKEFSKRGKKGERSFKLESTETLSASASAPSSPTSSSRRLAPLPEQCSLSFSSSPMSSPSSTSPMVTASTSASVSPATTPTASSTTPSPPTPRRWFSSFFQRRPSLDPKSLYQQQQQQQQQQSQPQPQQPQPQIRVVPDPSERLSRLRGLSTPNPTQRSPSSSSSSSSSSASSSASSSSSSPTPPPLIVHKTFKRQLSDPTSDIPAHVFIDVSPSPTSSSSPPSLSRSLHTRSPSPPRFSPTSTPVMATRAVSVDSRTSPFTQGGTTPVMSNRSTGSVMSTRVVRTPSPPLISGGTTPIMSIRSTGSTRTPSPPSTEKPDMTRVNILTEVSTRVSSKSTSSPTKSTSTSKDIYSRSPDATPVQPSRKISFGTSPPQFEYGDSKTFSSTISSQLSSTSLETRKKRDSLETSNSRRSDRSDRSDELEISRKRGEDGIAVVSAMFASSGFSTKKKQGPSPPRGLGSSQDAPTSPLDSSSHSSSSA